MNDREQEGGPPGWKRTTLGETLPIRYGKARNEKYGTVREDTPVYGSSGRIDTFDRALTGGPSLIIGRKGTVGATYYCFEPCWPIDTVYFTEAPADEDLRFFKYLLDHLQLARMDRSTAVPGLSRDDYNATDVFIPELDQQRLIVAEIEKHFSRLDEAVATLKRVKANLKRYKASVLKAAVEGNLTEAWRKQHPNIEPASKLLERILAEGRAKWTGRGKYKEPAAPDTNELPSQPKGWTWATVGQVAAPEPNSITDGPFGSNLKTEHYKEAGPRVIRLQNIGNGVFVNGKAHISEEHFARLQKHHIFAGDLVIAALGEDPPRSCLIPESIGHAIVKADCIRFKPHRGAVARYLNVVLNSEPTRQRAKSIVHGVGRPRLNLGEIKTIVVPVPPTVEQQAIVAEVERRLSVIEELEAAVEANLTRADRLRQSILSEAFCGKLLGGNTVGRV